MIHFKYQFQKDKAVFLLHLEILYLAEGLFLIPVQPGLCTQIQIVSAASNQWVLGPGIPFCRKRTDADGRAGHAPGISFRL